MINRLAPLPDFLVSRYRIWKSSSFINNEDHFKNLASLGQNPSSMVISCCDSRVHATSIFGADAGEFFIHRNIANLVPPYFPDGENHATSAAIEYAIIGMLPKGPLGRAMFRKLKVYSGPKHEHTAQLIIEYKRPCGTPEHSAHNIIGYPRPWAHHQ